MRIARYRTSKPGKPDKIKYSMCEISCSEWQELKTALDCMTSGLAREIFEQMESIERTPDLDAAAAGRGFDD